MCGLGGGRVTEYQSDRQRDGEPIDVNVHLVRHGFACRYARRSDTSNLIPSLEVARRRRRGVSCWRLPTARPRGGIAHH